METTKMVKWQLKAFDETEFYEVYLIIEADIQEI